MSEFYEVSNDTRSGTGVISRWFYFCGILLPVILVEGLVVKSLKVCLYLVGVSIVIVIGWGMVNSVDSVSHESQAFPLQIGRILPFMQESMTLCA